MLYFENDYCEGAHPAILQKLTETNFEKVSGYGTDPYCASAKAKICAACGCPDADVYFISGGTQTNAIVIASMLQRWQGVLAAATGHVAAHEAGAIEYTSHKVIPLPAHEGKVSAADVRSWCATFYADANHDHMVFPGMVYISHPSEYGTLYTKTELEAVSYTHLSVSAVTPAGGCTPGGPVLPAGKVQASDWSGRSFRWSRGARNCSCLLYTSPSCAEIFAT